MDNHYALGGSLGLPSPATLLLDDDVPLRGPAGLRPGYLECALIALSRSPHARIITPGAGMRLVVARASGGSAMMGVGRTWWRELAKAGIFALRRAIHGDPVDEGTPFCAGLPKTLLVSTALLRHYARAAPAALRAAVRAHPVCDDVAFSAVSHAALRSAGAPLRSPYMALVAPDSPREGVGEWAKGSLAKMPHHREERDLCWGRVLRAMASADARWSNEPLFLPSTEVATCSASAAAGGGRRELLIARAGQPYHAERNRTAAHAIDPSSCPFLNLSRMPDASAARQRGKGRWEGGKVREGGKAGRWPGKGVAAAAEPPALEAEPPAPWLVSSGSSSSSSSSSSAYVQTGLECELRVSPNTSEWRWAEWLSSSSSNTGGGSSSSGGDGMAWGSRPLDELPPVASHNRRQVLSGGRSHLQGRVTCRVRNLCFVGGQMVASPRAGRKAFEAAMAEAARRVRALESPGSAQLRRSNALLSIGLGGLKLQWADVPVANLSTRRGEAFLAPALDHWRARNVGHLGQGLFWHAAAAVASSPQPAVLLPSDEPLKAQGWAAPVAAATGASFVGMRRWLEQGGSGGFVSDVVHFSPANIGHPNNLPEEWFQSADAAEGMRRRLAAAFGDAIRHASCRSEVCVTLMLRRPPRQLLGIERLASSLRTHGRTHASSVEVTLESFERSRPFAEQLGVMARTTVLIAPHGAGLVNVAFMRRCAVVVEAYPCGLPVSFYGTLAWNSGKMYLPVYPAACGALVGGAVDVLKCVDTYSCRLRARSRPLNLSEAEATQLLDKAMALHRACVDHSGESPA